jgi:hypothetical protein
VRIALGFVLAWVSACGNGDRAWTYATPRVVDEQALLATLVPARAGERVLANFWASW